MICPYCKAKNTPGKELCAGCKRRLPVMNMSGWPEEAGTATLAENLLERLSVLEGEVRELKEALKKARHITDRQEKVLFLADQYSCIVSFQRSNSSPCT